MTSLIVGIDLSSKQIDAAIIPTDPTITQSVAYQTIPVTTLRDVRDAVRRICAHPRIVSVVVERPVGRYGLHTLLPVFGAVVASVPTQLTVEDYRPNVWRSILGANKATTKLGGQQRVADWLNTNNLAVSTEHHTDALGIALAHRDWFWRETA